MIKTLLAIFITLIVFNSFIGAKIEQPKKTTAVIGVLAFRSKNFEIIHSMGGFPQALLTPLYPEWPFSAAKKTNRFLANKVAVALLNLPYGSEVTKNAGYYGWNIPLSYEGIRSMMQELWVKPYDTIPTFSLKDVIARYAHSIIFSLTLIILLLMGFISKMRHLTHSLRSKSTSLEEQMAIMQEHEKSLRRAAGVFHNSQEGIVITEPQKRIIEVNEAFCQVTGYAREEVLGKKPIILRSGVHDKEFYDQLDESINTTGTWRGEIWNKKKNGELYAEFLRIDAIRDQNLNVENYIGIFSDITEHKIRQEQLHHMANYDPLTNLPNRHLFITLVEQILSFAKRKQTKAVVSFLDLDGFKHINDAYGHDVGDNVLRQVSHRLEKVLRQSDAIARIGGDEFVIVFSDIMSVKGVHPLFERILEMLKEPFVVNGTLMGIGVSIGAAFYPDHGEEIEILVRHADAAMYRSKANGRNQVTYFDQENMGQEML
jgi:diguanylate cyclase (GGDEF)-like protein/PAS domain S-box-containing protein